MVMTDLSTCQLFETPDFSYQMRLDIGIGSIVALGLFTLFEAIQSVIEIEEKARDLSTYRLVTISRKRTSYSGLVNWSSHWSTGQVVSNERLMK